MRLPNATIMNPPPPIHLLLSPLLPSPPSFSEYLQSLCVAIHLLLFYPLATIPGPWYTVILQFWLTTHILWLQQCQTIHSLFIKYGPVVRANPNKSVFWIDEAMPDPNVVPDIKSLNSLEYLGASSLRDLLNSESVTKIASI